MRERVSTAPERVVWDDCGRLPIAPAAPKVIEYEESPAESARREGLMLVALLSLRSRAFTKAKQNQLVPTYTTSVIGDPIMQ